MLHVVATPIGNLADLSPRALEAFKSAGLIACEDTRRTWQLLTHFGIPRPDLSLFLDVPFAFTERKLTEQRDGDDRDYLKGGSDIHEASLSLQQRVREVYLEAAVKDPALQVVDCSDEAGAMDSPEGIFQKIETLLNPLLTDYAQ